MIKASWDSTSIMRWFRIFQWVDMSARLWGLHLLPSCAPMHSILNQALGESSSGKASSILRIGAASAGVAAAFFFMTAAFGTARDTLEREASIKEIVEQLPLPALGPAEGSANTFTREVVIQRGDTLGSLLAKLDVDVAEAERFLRYDKSAAAFSRQLVPGKSFIAQVDADGNLESLVFPLNGENANALVVQRMPEGFVAKTEALPVSKRISFKSATIRQSLFGATDEAGIPDAVAMQMVEIFSGDIDFHRDLRKGDKFSLIYETTDYLGKPIGSPRILAAEFINAGKTYQAFWFQPTHGPGGYYTASGQSTKKAFLRSPLEFSRITSGFSAARYHPVLREIRAHRGIDYAAPIGTRVKATGDGVIDFVGVQGGYGKVIMIRHPGNRTTVYGHLSGFAPGLRKGMRVSQGEVIGFVGATGIATGPHLHYEFRVDGIHRNPLTVGLPDATPLTADQLPTFKAAAAKLMEQLASARDIRIALLD
ncbi:MAG: peptidoglycan DD-metalloendopeptidase family protein [Rhodocyclaceae bacterium]